MNTFKDMLPQAGKIGNIDAAVGDQKKFGERELPLAKDAQASGKGFSGIAVGDSGCSQAVKTCFAVGLQLHDPLHH